MTDWFACRLLAWFDLHGRRDLPWQHPRTPYTVWVSEVMLQQTQVRTVIPYFQRFLQRFPDVNALAAAPVDDVLHLWSGLGYYSRARNLHAAAKQVMAASGGEFPASIDALQALPGIGRSTAGAIAAMGFNVHAPILDGNVKRVLARFHGVEGHPGETAVLKTLWSFAEAHTPVERIADYTQAIMDLGATLCTRRNPDCGHCPVAEQCMARLDGRTQDIPSPKQRRSLPVRERKFWLVLRDDGACLLERRPPSGLWGGLWSPPERSPACSRGELAAQLGLALEAAGRDAPDPFTHVFTHLQMRVMPELALAASASILADRDDLLWYQPGINQRIGLSAVASRLLQELYGDNG